MLEKLNNQNGITLVELIVVIALSGVIITAAYYFLFANQSAYFTVMANSEAQTEARFAMDNIMTNIRRANQNELSTASDGNILNLQIKDNAGSLINYIYSVEKNDSNSHYKLVLTQGESKFIITNNLSSENGFFVTKISDTMLKITIKTTVKKYNQISKVELENYHNIMVDL